MCRRVDNIRFRDVTTDLSPSADSESKIRDDRLFSHGYQGQRSADDGFWRYLGESYRGDKAALGDYAGNFYTTFENDPDGRLCLRHDNMIYLPDKGEWFFYFGNACGTYPTEEDSRTRGSYFMLDTAPAPEAKNPAYPLFSDYRADAPATIDEGGYEEHAETVGGFLCFFGKRYNEDTDAYDKYVRIDGFIGADAAVTVPAEIKGIPVTRFRLGEADAVTSVTLPASLLNEANRDGLSGLNRLPKLTSITLDGKSDSGFVSGSAVYLSDGTMTELIAAARQRNGDTWSIPEGVTSIGTGIVCDTAKSLILPASLQNADGNMILSALENVTIAKGNASFRVIGGALYHLGENGKPDSLVLLPEKSGIKALDIPEGVRQVGKLRCDTLEAICFPASAQTITTFSHGIGSSRLSALQEIQVAAALPNTACSTAWNAASTKRAAPLSRPTAASPRILPPVPTAIRAKHSPCPTASAALSRRSPATRSGRSSFRKTGKPTPRAAIFSAFSTGMIRRLSAIPTATRSGTASKKICPIFLRASRPAM